MGEESKRSDGRGDGKGGRRAPLGARRLGSWSLGPPLACFFGPGCFSSIQNRIPRIWVLFESVWVLKHQKHEKQGFLPCGVKSQIKGNHWRIPINKYKTWIYQYIWCKYVGNHDNKVQSSCMHFTCINIPKLNLCLSSSIKVTKLTWTLEFVTTLQLISCIVHKDKYFQWNIICKCTTKSYLFPFHKHVEQ